MSLDETQALDISMDTEDENYSFCYKKLQVATLIIKTSSDGNKNMSFSIYNGINKIGRNPDIEITMNSEFISRHHCTIEYINSNHLIFDCSSRNKTIKNKLCLIPEVRYELRDGDTLKFGDITCEYKFCSSIANQIEPGTKAVKNNSLKNFLDVDLCNNNDSGETIDSCCDDSIVSEDLLINANQEATLNFCDLTSTDGDQINLEVLTLSYKTVKPTFDKIQIISEEPSAYNPLDDILPGNASPRIGDNKIIKNVSEFIVPENQLDSQVKPKKMNTPDSKIIFDASVLDETSPIIGNTICPLKVEESLMSLDFSAETQDIDEDFTLKRKIEGSVSYFNTRISDTPEKDQFECCTPIGPALNLKSRWDSFSFDETCDSAGNSASIYNFEAVKNFMTIDNDEEIKNDTFKREKLQKNGDFTSEINNGNPILDQKEAHLTGFEYVEKDLYSTQYAKLDVVIPPHVDKRDNNLTVKTKVNNDKIVTSDLNGNKNDLSLICKDRTYVKESKYSSLEIGSGEILNHEFVLRDIPDAINDASSLFPKSYAHKNTIRSGKNSKLNKIANLSLNKSYGRMKMSKRNSKKIVSAKLLSRCASIHKKTLFGSINDEFELKRDSDLFDTFSERRKSRDESAKEEALNAKDIQIMVTGNLSTSSFKKKFEVAKKISGKKQFNCKINFLKLNQENLNCEMSRCEGKRMSKRTSKGKKQYDPYLARSDSDEVVKNVQIDGNQTKSNNIKLNLAIGLSEMDDLKDSTKQDSKRDTISIKKITKRIIGNNIEAKSTIDHNDPPDSLKSRQGRKKKIQNSLIEDKSANASKYPPIIYYDKDFKQMFDSDNVNKIKSNSLDKLSLNRIKIEENINEGIINPKSENSNTQIICQSASESVITDDMNVYDSVINKVHSNQMNPFRSSQSTLFKNDLLRQGNEKGEFSVGIAFTNDASDDVPSHQGIDNFGNNNNEMNHRPEYKKRKYDIQDGENMMAIKKVSKLNQKIKKSNILELNKGNKIKRSTRKSALNEDIFRSDSDQSIYCNNKPKILFTGVKEGDALKMLKKLGGEEADSIFDCSHIISDQVRRTIKFLCGMAKGIPIVSLEWLKECKNQKKFIDAYPYLINDAENESKFKFNLKKSLQYSSARKLFDGLSFHITKNVKPEPSEMKEIIMCADGKIVESMPRDYSEKLIVISCVDDLKCCEHLYIIGVPVVSSEFVMTGILRYVVDIEGFNLFQKENKLKSN